MLRLFKTGVVTVFKQPESCGPITGLFSWLVVAVHKGSTCTSSMTSFLTGLYSVFQDVYMIRGVVYTPISTVPIITTTRYLNTYCYRRTI